MYIYFNNKLLTIKLKLNFLKNIKILRIYHFNFNTLKLYINYGKSLLKMLPGFINTFIYYNREFNLIIKKNYNIFIINFLKKYTHGLFNILSDICAVDYIKNIYRFEIIYTLLSYYYNCRILLKTYLLDFENINSITNIFLCANWFEREIFDFFGIIFKNNIDLRRILTNYGFNEFPLRKDFNLSYCKEISFNIIKNKLVYEYNNDFYSKKKKN